MKKINLILLMILVSATGLMAQSYNPFTQNIHFIPEPTVAGFSCGSTQQVEFTQGITTADSATQWQTDPLKVRICIAGFEFDGTSAAAVVSGTYSSNFNWAFDPAAPNCLVGTQNQTLYGTGTNPLFPDPRASGLIAVNLMVPETSPIATVLSVNVTLEIPAYFANNSLPDDNESTQTQTFCDLKIKGTVFHDTLPVNGTIDKDMPLGNPDGQPLYVNLIDNLGNVVAVKQVGANGQYEFNNVAGFNTYQVILTNVPGTVGNPAPIKTSVVLLPNWTHTGEDCCDGTGEDNNNDGILSVTVTNASRENADFGINWVIPTPVRMSSFDVAEYNCSALISWATVSEENVSHFEILRQDEKNGPFNKIKKMTAAGNSTSEKLYSFIDKTIEPRSEAYSYRIKTVDFDFSESFSDAKSIFINCNGGQVNAQVFPNPASNAINLIYTTEENDIQLIVDVVDLTGRKLISKSQIVNKGSSIINLDIESLAVGQYMVRYHSVEGNTTGTIKFSKSK